MRAAFPEPPVNAIARRDCRNAAASALLVAVCAIVLYQLGPQFFWRDDFQVQYLPASYEVANAWRSGTMPLLTRGSWMSSALGAEYQYGAFSIFRGLLDVFVWSLPLTLTAIAATLFIVHAFIVAAGAFLLARSYGIRSSLAVVTAIVGALNGWMLWWGTDWFPGIASFAWLPWYWLALRGVVTQRSHWSWLGVAVTLYLIVTAGWPYTVAMAAVVACMNIAVALVAKRARAVAAMIGASALGLGLAAPAPAMLLEYVQITARNSALAHPESIWVVPPAGLPGLILPVLSASWAVWAGQIPHPAVELLGGFVPLACIAAGLAGARFRLYRERWAELIVLALLLVAMLLPGIGTFRWSFRWLPLFHLMLAIVGGAAFEMANRERAFRRPSVMALMLIAFASCVALVVDHEKAATLAFAALIAMACVVWAFLEREGHRYALVAPAVITVVSIFATFALQRERGEVPVWNVDDQAVRRAAPFDPSRRYLALYQLRDVLSPDDEDRLRYGVQAALRPGNMGMLSGLRFVNGYTPLGPATLVNLFAMDVHGPVLRIGARRTIERETARNGLLHHMGVDGLVVPTWLAVRHRSDLGQCGWRYAGSVGSCTILHREPRLSAAAFAPATALQVPDHDSVYDVVFERQSSALPVVLLGGRGWKRYGFRELVDIRESRLKTELEVRGRSGPALVVFRRLWIPGWRAKLNGAPLPVRRADLLLPAVEIPAGAEGKLTLYYLPRSLVAGAAVAALSAVLILAIAIWLWRRR